MGAAPADLARLREQVRGRRELPFLDTTLFLDAYLDRLDAPAPIRETAAIAARVARQKIFIYDDELIVGRLAFEFLDFHHSFGLRLAFPVAGKRYLLDPDAAVLRELAGELAARGLTEESVAAIVPAVRRIALVTPQRAIRERMSTRARDAADAQLMGPAYWGGHSVVDYPTILANGLGAIRRDIEHRRAGSTTDAERTSREAMALGVGSVQRFIERHGELAEERTAVAGSRADRERLGLVAETCRWIAEHPPRSFHEALQLTWFIHIMEGCDSLGRLDQYLLPYYRRDVAEGRIDRERARELVCHFFLKVFETYCIQNLTIGGRTPAGDDGANDLTRLCLSATRELRLPQPNLSVRWCSDSPAWLREESIATIGRGLGVPALYNDEVIVPGLVATGVALDDARDYALAGCSEIVIPGTSHFSVDAGLLNVAKCLELTLNDGIDPVSGLRLGPSTGACRDFGTFDELLAAFQGQLAGATDLLAEALEANDDGYRERCGYAIRSAFTQACRETGRGIWEGGAVYNASQVECIGITNTVNSLAAIRDVVYERRRCSLADLAAILRADWEGHRELLLHCRTRSPKFGNDVDSVDRLAVDIRRLVFSVIRSHRCRRGGVVLPGEVVVESHLGLGAATGATADGRRRGEPLADSAGPSPGTEWSGPTAVLTSLTKTDQRAGITCIVLNLKFDRSQFESESSTKLRDMVQTYFALGGMQVQINVLDDEALRNARRHPELHPELSVRVGGYSAFFVNLDPNVQDDIIARTAHGTE